MTLHHRAGQIGIRNIETVCAHDDVLVWEVALEHRAPEVWVNNIFGPNGDGHQLSLIRSTSTRDWDLSTDRATLLTFYSPDDHPRWRVLTHVAGATLRVVAYRTPGHARADRPHR